MKKILTFLFFFVCLMQVCAQTKKINQVKYKVISATEAEVDDGSKVQGVCVIPSEVKIGKRTYAVTSIGKYAFNHNKDLSSIVLPHTITAIRSWAFNSCSSLKFVEIPPATKTIGDCAFWFCSNLENVTLHEGLERIDELAFADTKLRKIVLPKSIRYMGNGCFKNIQTLEEITSPAIIFHLPSYDNKFVSFFYDCNRLRKLNTYDGLPPYYLYEPQPFNEENKWVKDPLKPCGEMTFEIPVDCPLQKAINEEKETYAYYENRAALIHWVNFFYKRPGETDEAFKLRISQADKARIVQEGKEMARESYIQEKAPRNVPIRLGAYNSRTQTFVLTAVDQQQTFYVKVPRSQSAAFKRDWAAIKILTHFDLIDEKPVLVRLELKHGDRTYRTLENDAASLAQQNAPQAGKANDELTGLVVKAPQTKRPADLTIDQNIPVNEVDNKDTYALVVGVENYQTDLHPVHAGNDALIFSEYCKKTLGIPAGQVMYYPDATFQTIVQALTNLMSVGQSKEGKIKVLFYFAGEGGVDVNKNPLLLPSDFSFESPNKNLYLQSVCKLLGLIPASSVTAFIDTHFNGQFRGQDRRPLDKLTHQKTYLAPTLTGPVALFSATSTDESAYIYNDKHHGMFTYFLLKKLRETRGRISLGDLVRSVTEDVKATSFSKFKRAQTPEILVSDAWKDAWQQTMLR